MTGVMRYGFTLFLLALPSYSHADRKTELLMVGAAAADIITTEIGLAHHGIEEANPLLRHQGARIATKVGVTAGLILAARRLDAGHPKMAAWLRWIPIVGWSSAAGVNISMTVAVGR